MALDARADEGAIVLFCGEKPLPPDMSLLTALVFHWKQGGDMMLSYADRRRGKSIPRSRIRASLYRNVRSLMPKADAAA